MEDKEAISLFYQMHKLITICKSIMRLDVASPHLERLSLRHNEFQALSHLYHLSLEHPGGVTGKQLAAAMPVSQPAISMTLDKLVEKGCVERRENPSDRRSILLTLTPRAHAEMESMAIRQGCSIAKILEAMPKERKQAMLDFIESADAYFRQAPS